MSDPRPLCGLQRASALCSLATAIFYTRAIVFDLDARHWDALSVDERHTYMTLAESALDAVKPEAPVESVKQESPLFDLAVKLTRLHTATVLAFEPTREV